MILLYDRRECKGVPMEKDGKIIDFEEVIHDKMRKTFDDALDSVPFETRKKIIFKLIRDAIGHHVLDDLDAGLEIIVGRCPTEDTLMNTLKEPPHINALKSLVIGYILHLTKYYITDKKKSPEDTREYIDKHLSDALPLIEKMGRSFNDIIKIAAFDTKEKLDEFMDKEKISPLHIYKGE